MLEKQSQNTCQSHRQGLSLEQVKRIGKSLPSQTNRKQDTKLRLASGPVQNKNTVPWWLEPVVFNRLIPGVMEGSQSNTNKEETRPELRTGTGNYWVRGNAATSPKQGPGPQDASATRVALQSWEIPAGKKQGQGQLGAGLKQEATLGTIRQKKLSNFPGHILVLALKAHMPGIPSSR